MRWKMFGHISYSQAQPVTDVPPIVQTLKK